MPVDQTALLKARAKILQENKNISSDDAGASVSKRVRASPVYIHYAKLVTQLNRDMTEFFALVSSKSVDYLSFYSPFSVMSDEERDKFDAQSDKLFRHLSGLVQNYWSQIKKDGMLKTSCEEEHLLNALHIQQQRLAYIGNMVTGMRKLHLKYISDRKQYGKLSSLTEKMKSSGFLDRGDSPFLSNASRDRIQRGQIKVEADEHEEESGSGWDNLNEDIEESGWDLKEDVPNTEGWDNWDDSEDTKKIDLKSMEPETSLRKRNVKIDADVFDRGNNESEAEAEQELHLSEGEKAQLQAENEMLLEKFTQAHKEMDVLETQIIEIQRLQETLTEKLADQEKDIEFVHETAVHTTENLRDGNEWIRQAISNSAGRRVVVLFCIIVITFTLLFLDWYNP